MTADIFREKADQAYAAIKALFVGPRPVDKPEPTDQEIRDCLNAVSPDEQTWVRVLRRVADIIEDDPTPFRPIVINALGLGHVVRVTPPENPEGLVLELTRTQDPYDGDDTGFAVQGKKSGKVVAAYQNGKAFILQQEWDPLELATFLDRAPVILKERT